MRIDKIELGPKPLLLAPMEDVSDPPFRILCKRYGADLLYTEFISAGGLVHGADSSLQKLEFYDEERPLAIQIFGGEEDQVREAAGIADAAGPDLIDINFGCPVKKVVCHDGGAGILRDLPKMERLTGTVVDVATRPVTVKTRLGWDESTIRIIEVARMLERVGIAALAVHARTRHQMYTGEARWEWLRRIKDEAGLAIPLIGNGDATGPERVRDMFDQTGVDAVMIGRGAIGNPWIFRDTRALIDTGELPPAPSWAERVSVVAEHLALKCAWLGERKGVLEMRRMYGGYFKARAGASELRTRLVQAETQADVLEVLLNAPEKEAGVRVPVPVAVRGVPVRLPPTSASRASRPVARAA